jgi:UPF0716 protein FxsA
MFFYLLLLFTLVPFVELALLLWLAQHIGLFPTIAMVLLTGVLGASLARWQGLRTLGRIQQEMATGKVPGDALVDGMLILVAGAVLLTPGVLTDACGFALLIPPIRSLLKTTVRRWFASRVSVQTASFTSGGWTNAPGAASRDQIVDVEVTNTRVVDDD